MIEHVPHSRTLMQEPCKALVLKRMQMEKVAADPHKVVFPK